jgi:general secretion pathway protein C
MLAVHELLVLIDAVARPPVREAVESRPPAPTAAPEGRDVAAPESLADAHLFGVAPREPEPAPAVLPANLPDSSLGLTLTGILFGADDSHREAIVADGRGGQRVYRAGQEVDGVAGTQVFAVLSDHVVLQRGGVLETLRLTKQAPAAVAEPASRAVGAPRAQTAAAAAAPAPAAAPTRSDVVRVVRRTREGAFTGFAVFPGENRDAFAALGLQPEDVVTQVNGVALDGPDKAGVLFEALGKSGPVNLSFRRGSSYQSVSVDLSHSGAAPVDEP